MAITAERTDCKAPAASTAVNSEDDGRKRSASPAKGAPVVDDTEAGAAAASDPPLPEEEAPPLPAEAPPEDDDGWDFNWDEYAKAYVFFNHLTGEKTWTNPRLSAAENSYNGSYDRYATSGYSTAGYPTSTYPTSGYPTSSYATSGDPGYATSGYATSGYPTSSYPTSGDPASATDGYPTDAPGTSSPPRKRLWGGYDPKIHGAYNPNADYALEAEKDREQEEAAAAANAAASDNMVHPGQNYSTQAHFNRFTGKFQQPDMGPDMHNDENKTKRQMNAFFDVDAAANSHDGRSLKAERRNKTFTKKEIKAFNDKRHKRKEEKRRAWLRE